MMDSIKEINEKTKELNESILKLISDSGLSVKSIELEVINIDPLGFFTHEDQVLSCKCEIDYAATGAKV